MTVNKTELEGSDPAAFDTLSSTDWRAAHNALMWCLYGAGFLLVVFSHSLGNAMAPRKYYAPNSFSWNPADARGIEANTQIVGAMVFAAGLVERLVLAITSGKQKQTG